MHIGDDLKYICIIQARTTSSRLPAKSLLPIANMPLAVLCAKRATSKFHDTWVVTSDQASDDLLAKYLEISKIPCFRGNLNNVLNRFCTLCSYQNIKPEDTIIRLTADNPLVDNKFIEKMKVIWESYDLDYLSAEPDDLTKHGWPKGLSAEFFRAQSIYQLNNNGADKMIKEHVTPSIKKFSKKKKNMVEFEKLGFSFKLSYGIDFLKDYLFVERLFQEVNWDVNYDKILKKSQLLELDVNGHLDGR